MGNISEDLLRTDDPISSLGKIKKNPKSSYISSIIILKYALSFNISSIAILYYRRVSTIPSPDHHFYKIIDFLKKKIGLPIEYPPIQSRRKAATETDTIIPTMSFLIEISNKHFSL